jgi:hypothetical protein
MVCFLNPISGHARPASHSNPHSKNGPDSEYFPYSPSISIKKIFHFIFFYYFNVLTSLALSVSEPVNRLHVESLSLEPTRSENHSFILQFSSEHFNVIVFLSHQTLQPKCSYMIFHHYHAYYASRPSLPPQFHQ